jgi:hypothetical protein
MFTRKSQEQRRTTVLALGSVSAGYTHLRFALSEPKPWRGQGEANVFGERRSVRALALEGLDRWCRRHLSLD